MEPQDNKRMCGSFDYNHDLYHEVYDEDYFGDMLNILDLPVETLEGGDGLAEDWASKLGPIPSEVFREILPPVGSGGVGGGSTAGVLKESYILKDEIRRPQQPNLNFSEEKKRYLMPKSFEAPSPDSVLERGSSSSSNKTISFRSEPSVPVKTRTKRSRSGSTTNPWLRSPVLFPLQKQKKKKRRIISQQQPGNNETKKCSHCEITKTPQWREGPMGPKTLCNACGVRYRSGRLFPEYRPAASPTFIPSVHSNSHRKVIEMRQKGGGVNDNNSYVMKKVLSSDLTDTTRLCSS